MYAQESVAGNSSRRARSSTGILGWATTHSHNLKLQNHTPTYQPTMRLSVGKSSKWLEPKANFLKCILPSSGGSVRSLSAAQVAIGVSSVSSLHILSQRHMQQTHKTPANTCPACCCPRIILWSSAVQGRVEPIWIRSRSTAKTSAAMFSSTSTYLPLFSHLAEWNTQFIK